MCQERGKDWEGSDPNCYFDEPLYENWNCATINAIRDICGDWFDEQRNGAVKFSREDTTACLIDIWDCDIGADDEYAFSLYVQWYKRRGATERVLLLGENVTREPTERELLAIIEYYEKLLKGK